MPAAQGILKDRPLPRLVQQLYRKHFTGHFVITDATQDQSQVYMRDGALVHVSRPVDIDRLDNLLLSYGLVSPEVMAEASRQLGDGVRLGEVLDRMGALDKVQLAQVLKSQVVRKISRLFFVAEGSYAVFLEAHDYGAGGDFALMRVDPRTVMYPGIRSAYDLPRVTQELSRLIGQRFRLGQLSSGFVTALGIAADDATIAALRSDWLTLEQLDAIAPRALEARAVVLALYYCDLLERQPVASPAAGAAVPSPVRVGQSSDSGSTLGVAGAAETASPLPPPPPLFSASTAPAEPAFVRPNVPGETVAALPRSSASPTPPAPAVSVAAASTTREPAAGLPAQAKPAPVARHPTLPSLPTPPTPPVPSSPPAPSPSPSVPRPSPSGEALRATIQDMVQKLDRMNHFEALGIAQSATADEVSAAFVRAARQFHPDRLSGAGLADLATAAGRILARINEAAMVLGDATRRAEYVASLAAGPKSTRANLPTVLEAENTFLKGEAFLKKGEHAKAVECFTQATQGNPDEPQYRAYLAWARFDDPRTRKEAVARETLRLIEAVMQERPRFARGHYWIGLLWKLLGDFRRAEQAFREAVTVDGTFIDASRELRLIEMRRSKSTGGKPDSGRGGLVGKLFKK